MCRLLFILACASVGACFSPKYSNGSLRCQSGPHPCPDGYHCAVDNTCWKNGQDPTPQVDMSSPSDTADMGGADMAQPPVVTYPPAAVWTAGGGGSATAISGNQLNLSLSPSIIGGTATSPNNSTATFGFFSNDIYQ